MPERISDKLLSWAVDPDPKVLLQAGKASRLPFVEGHVALMPDAHFGIGASVGSVIPTKDAIIPAAVGVDIGCGMVASRTSLTLMDLPDDLEALMPLVEARIPAGVGRGHAQDKYKSYSDPLTDITHPHATEFTTKQLVTINLQYGTLGSGNHFVEVCFDENEDIWTVLHSGSRGIGNQLAQAHIKRARGLMKELQVHLEDPDLAYLTQGSTEFNEYINDMLWAQEYALKSRARMDAAITRSLFEVTGHGRVLETINCHHNFTQREAHGGQDLWITRKGAIKAAVGDRGVIPGSMGTRSYIVAGLGSTASYTSCSHGAGRRMSRTQARREIPAGTLTTQMAGKTWNSGRAASLVDEAPDAYKNIEEVMAAQSDLVTVEHELTQIFNYKG